MLNAQIVHLKRQGEENVKHKPAIKDEDLKKLKISQAISHLLPCFKMGGFMLSCSLSERKRRPEGTQKVKFQI